MKILVMRPSPAGEFLVNKLRAIGQIAYYMPLIHFSPGCDLPQLPHALMQLNIGDLVFIMSQHSVHYADSVIGNSGLQWPSHLAYYAIGPASGLALSRISSLAVCYPKNTAISETLLMLPSLQKLDGKQALILRGNRGRKLLGNELEERGAKVNYYECYHRIPVYYDGNKKSTQWQQAGIDTLIVTSAEMLEQLYTLVPHEYRSLWLLRCCLVVVSERLAILAQKLGWSTIRLAESADNDALIRVLK